MGRWNTVAAYLEGTRHRKTGTECQDYGEVLAVSEEMILGALADGAGRVKYSSHGAALAVKTTLQMLAQADWKPITSEEETRAVFLKVLDAVGRAFSSRAGRAGWLVNDMACTLLAFVATPDWLAAMQVGDGAMVVRTAGGEYELLFTPDKGEYVNTTTFVTSANAGREMQTRMIRRPPVFICAASDGLEHVSIRYRDWTPHQPFFAPLEKYIASQPNKNQANIDFLDFLDSDRLNAKTDDDKTMILGALTKSE
ncbi:MAG: protein phosphatase 2C domain-containing protein [Deltaproteobacteria bacterium]|nr:protein phosphatase 2C domain-containing protein [Deltaproteobacteria bacterium]